MDPFAYVLIGFALGFTAGRMRSGGAFHWKQALIAFLIAAALAAGFMFLRDPFGGGGPVSPSALKPGATEFGTLRVTVLADSRPVADVEVDLGTIGPSGPTGAMSAVQTDDDGVAIFEQVPVGTYDLFWNDNAFPEGYQQPPDISITIAKDRTTDRTVILTPSSP
ncbi:MAG TPA: carboxypeptidase-like regulatory domain-containing protein [Candidatus Paceibacterota bacterium]|nr:carboxypeptidase-like regulatory domain-containing protein [Candidatus Paceibacterota bacterium]